MAKTVPATKADSTRARDAAVRRDHIKTGVGIAGLTGIGFLAGGPKGAAAGAAGSLYMGCLVSCHLGPAPEPRYEVPPRVIIPEVSTEDEELEEVKQAVRRHQQNQKKK